MSKEQQEPQVSRIDKMILRQKKPWVINEDYGIITENTRSLGTCSGCDTKHYCSHIDKSGRRYCGDCIDKLSGVTKAKENKPKEKVGVMSSRTMGDLLIEAVTHDLDPEPISNQIDLTVIMGGKVYDLVVRDEVCDHSNQKFVDSMKNTKSNFCADCGKIMNYRKPKAKEIKKPTERKEKKNVKARTNK